MDCSSYCTADSYKISSLHDALRSRFKTAIYDDVLHTELSPEINAFFFPYGAAVFWGANLEEAKPFLEELKPYEHHPMEVPETDEFTVEYGEKPKVTNDELIVLPDKTLLSKLAVSHGIAQSVKLEAFEERLSRTHEQTKSIPEDLAKHGKIHLSRGEIRRKMGALFLERSSISLYVDALDKPEFFWEHTELEPLYHMIAYHLDLEERVEVLNRRLNVIRELFEILTNELNHQHSSRLEWIIIILIVIEVALTLLHDIFEIV